jgi:hypothetical protein
MPTRFCRHVRPSGRRCQSFALHNKPFCFHHANVIAHHRTLNPPDDGSQNIVHPMYIDPARFEREPFLADYFATSRGPINLHFPAIEDAQSIQLALSMLIKALGHDRIDTKRAATMLYALQIAGQNARHLTPDTGPVVTSTEIDEAGNLLCTDEDIEELTTTLSS